MSYRFMRVLVFFDLPVGTVEERRAYSQFRRKLVKNGFLMLQESVYCKLTLNASGSASIMDFVRSVRPKAGQVQMLVITEKQFSRMELVTGEYKTEIINDDERLVIL